MGTTDYLEQYFAINIIFEPLVGELFRSGFLMRVAAANHDFITPPVISAAEADYERNLANTIDLIYLLANDETHGAHNRALFKAWVGIHRPLAEKAALALQPIWSTPHSAGLLRRRARTVGRAHRPDPGRTWPQLRETQTCRTPRATPPMTTPSSSR